MPITASAEFAVEVEGVEQYRRAAALTIYPPASDYLDFTHALSAVTVTAAMTSALPDNARIQAGDEAVTGDFTLGGSFDVADETMDAADFFNPDNPGSPIYHLALNGCRAVFEWGAYVPGSAAPEQPGKLTGWINGVDFDWDARTATVHVIDLDPDWGDTPEIPAVVTASPYNAGLTSEFAMDALIRKMKGQSTWPAVRPNCLLATGLRSSLWPEVGTLLNSDIESFTYVPGVHGSAIVGTSDAFGLSHAPTYLLDAPIGTTLRIEGWFTPLSAGGVTPDFFFGDSGLVDGIDLSIDGHGVLYNTGSLVGTLGPGIYSSDPFYCEVVVTVPAVGGTGWRLDAKINGVSYSSGSLTRSTARPSTTWQTGIESPGTTAAYEAVQASAETTSAVSNYGFVPIAILDPSLNPLTVVPEIVEGTSSWQEMQTMAAAECGYVRRDPDGIIRFTNRINLLNQPVGRTISGDSSLGPLSTSIQPSSANHKVNVSYTEWDYGDPGLVWTIGSKKKIPANSVVTWTQKITDGTLVAQVDGTASKLGTSQTPGDSGHSQYLIAGDKAGNGDHPGLRSLTIAQLTATTFQIAADNRGGPPGYLVVPSSYSGSLDAGTPALWIGGIPVTSGDAATVTVSSGDGKNPLDFDDSAYLQDHDTAAAVGLFVLRQCRWDVREFGDVPIKPDPRILCGDLDKLVEQTRSKVNDYVMVWGYTFTATFPPPGSDDSGQWSQTLSARSLGPPDSWLGGQIPDRAEASISWAY